MTFRRRCLQFFPRHCMYVLAAEIEEEENNCQIEQLMMPQAVICRYIVNIDAVGIEFSS